MQNHSLCISTKISDINISQFVTADIEKSMTFKFETLPVWKGKIIKVTLHTLQKQQRKLLSGRLLLQ